MDKKTISHHLKSPWLIELNDTNYYFCDDPDCEVVYFGLKGSLINKSELRTKVGLKEKDDQALVCYCFGVSKIDAEQKPEIKSFIIEQTKNTLCSCDTSNPSGRCCLKDFAK